MIAAICKADPECAAFNNDGVLFKRPLHMTPSTGMNLYILK